MSRNLLESKHKSLIERPSENMFKPNPNSVGGDYLLNSETLYRNEIRKSIRNVMLQKRYSTSGITTSSTSNVVIKRPEPFYFYNEGLEQKRIVSGVYLSANHATTIENSSTPLNSSSKLPAASLITSSSAVCASKPFNGKYEDSFFSIQEPNNRNVLYLERRPSNEYESRV